VVIGRILFVMRWFHMPALAAAAMVLGACEPNSRPGHSAPLEPGAGAGTGAEVPPVVDQSAPPNTPPDAARAVVPAWPFWPERLRVHPLTRLVTDSRTGRNLLEARIEFFDAQGATTKASGQLTLRLFGDAAQPDSADPLETWNLNLRDLSVNAQQFDDITRTYLMRLEIDPTRLASAPELRAYFVGANGALLNGTMPLKP
jgi:hypothetical protein